MVDVLFSDSAAGTMNMAKLGNPIICLGWMLDIGQLDIPVASSYRYKLIHDMYFQGEFPYDEKEDGEEGIGGRFAHEMKKLKDFLNQGETIRVWYSFSPDAMCGFYFICDFMKTYKNDLIAVKLPEHMQKDNTVLSFSRWEEVEHTDIKKLQSLGKTVSKDERRMITSLWNDLVMENAPLRAVINGKLISVEESFYDFILWKYITDIPTKEVRIIGDILGNYQLGIGDSWYARRIDHYIETGEIGIIEDHEKKYQRIIARK